VVRLKLPTEFIEKYQNLLQAEAPAFFASLQQNMIKAFRLNPLRPNWQSVKADLSEPIEYVPTGFYGEINGRSLEHQTGYLYSQDPSAMYVAEVAEIHPGEKVLDLCAAPGGKSTQLAGKLAGQGLLVSNEINRARAKILAENLERIGAKNVLVVNERPDRLVKTFKGFFDKVLVDAPCSGEGMFRKDPAAVKYWSAAYPAECAACQREILTSALEMLRPGGQLIYSTCTFAPEEDEQIAAWLLEKAEIAKILPIKKWPRMDSGHPEWANDQIELENCVRLFPHHFQGEGHFIAKFQATQASTGTIKKKVRKKKKQHSKLVFRDLTASEKSYWQKFAATQFISNWCKIADLRVFNERLFYYPQSWPDISALHFVRPGLELGVFKKGRFEPAYSLALAQFPTESKNVIQLSIEQWNQYVQGLPLREAAFKQLPDGWYLLSCQQKSFSFGKLTQGTLKNSFPKGLRLRYGN
jgi:NOL1/NOP2/sun family putative RNA methylase